MTSITPPVEKPYPAWICEACGTKYGNREVGVATWHKNTCGVCGEEAFVTEPRDFGHLRTGWEYGDVSR